MPEKFRPACPECKVALSKDRIKKRHIDGLQGWIVYERKRYYCPKCKKGYYPLDAELGLSETSRMSRQKEKQLVSLSVRLPYEEVKKVYGELTGFWVGRMTAHRTVQKMGEEIQKSSNETCKKEAKKQREGKRHITADGTMVNIRNEGWKEAKVGASYSVGSEHKTQGLIYAGTLKDRERFGDILYKASGEPEMEETKSMAFIGDAAEWLDNLKEFHFPMATRIVDVWHVEERIWKLAKSCYDEHKADIWAKGKIDLLRKGLQKSVQKSFVHMKTKTEEQKNILEETRRYFRNHGHKMDYPRYETMGFHIGSGVAEGACKYVIQARFKQAGMRWSRQGAENLLALRIKYLNNGSVQIPELLQS